MLFGIKTIFSKHGHKKCSSTKSYHFSKVVKGKFLNEYLFHAGLLDSVEHPLNDRKNYHICSNLYRYIVKYTVQNPIEQYKSVCSVISSIPTDVDDAQPPGKTCDRETRLFMRNRIGVKDLSGIKQVNLYINGEVDTVIQVENDESLENNGGYNEIYVKKVLDGKPYKLPFHNLVMRERNRRVNDVCKLVMNCCIDRGEFKDQGANYYKANKDLAVSIITFLDSVRETLERKIGLDFGKLNDEALPPVDGDNDGMITDANGLKQNRFEFAKLLLGKTTRNVYTELAGKYKNNNDHALPSPFMLYKTRPLMEQVSFPLLNDTCSSSHSSLPTGEIDVNTQDVGSDLNPDDESELDMDDETALLYFFKVKVNFNRWDQNQRWIQYLFGPAEKQA